MSKNPVTLGKDISLNPTPFKAPTAFSPTVVVIGGGVTGLVTSWVLLDRGYHVTILAKEWASYGKDQRLTSQIAGALWEYPPAVCGQHTDAISLHHSKRWSLQAYDIWAAIAADPDLSEAAGVRMKRSDFFFREQVEQNPGQYKKMKEIMKTRIQGFKRDPSLAQKRGVNPDYGVVDAYEHLAPIIDTDRAMTWLMGLVESKGGRFLTETITGDLLDREDELRSRFGADAIINCTGLAGSELAGDKTCYPIRGGLIRVINDGKDFPKVNDALIIAADGVNEIVFLVPRNDNILLIGGCTQPHEWKLDLTLDSPIVKRMRARCEAFLPALKKARLDPEYPFAQGLRPFRQQNVRVERELRPKITHGRKSVSRLVHSYGQGGAGWSLSFGCAGDVALLVEQALYDLPAVALSRTLVPVTPMQKEPAPETVGSWAYGGSYELKSRI
jgi:glycine/D-amino acid oxidase-like deaminating enzyme